MNDHLDELRRSIRIAQDFAAKLVDYGRDAYIGEHGASTSAGNHGVKLETLEYGERALLELRVSARNVHVYIEEMDMRLAAVLRELERRLNR